MTLHLIPVSYGGSSISSTSTYEAHFIRDIFDLPRYTAVRVARSGAQPLIGGVNREGRTMFLEVWLGTSGTMAGLKAIFDPDDEQAKALIARRSDGTNVYVMAVCSEIKEDAGGSGLAFVVTLEIHGEVHWRAATATTTSQSISSSGQTFTVSNPGDILAYPKITITPTSARSGGNNYQRFVVVEWGNAYGVSNHPIDIVGAGLDTRVSPTTNFATSDGADIRLWVDGKVADFWLGNINTATTRVWVNLDMAAGVSLTLDGAIDALATTLVVNEAITDLPAAGMLRLNSGEVVTYTSKDNATQTVSGVVRGAKNTTAATQADGTAVKWLQHDIVITYGDATLAAYVPDDTKKPVFNLTSSTNTSWVYSGVFGDDARRRTGGWVPSAGLGSGTADAGYCYTRDHSVSGTAELVSPWDCVGVAQANEGITRFWLYNPRGISAANITGGKTKTTVGAAAASFARVETSADGNVWITELAISATVNTSWTTFSQNLTSLYTSSTKETKYVSLTIEEGADDTESYKAMVTAVTMTLQTGVTVAVGAENSAYSTDVVISNSTRSEQIRVRSAVATGVPIEIDCANFTAVRTDDNSSVIGAIDAATLRRKRWMSLNTGDNTIAVTETGLAGVDVDFDLNERYYD